MVNQETTSKSCCFCIPLRSGLIAAGCINSILDLVVIILLCHHIVQLCFWYFSHWFPLLETIISGFTVLLYTNDLIFNMILLYGCYKKDFIKLRVFYKYNIFYVICNMIFIIYLLLELFFSRNKWDIKRLIMIIFIGLWIMYNLFTIYLTASLIRSEEEKLENNMQMTHANGTRTLTAIEEDVEQPIPISDESF